MGLLPQQRVRHRVLGEHDVQVRGDQGGQARQPVQQPEEAAADVLVTTDARWSVVTGEAEEGSRSSIVNRSARANAVSIVTDGCGPRPCSSLA